MANVMNRNGRPLEPPPPQTPNLDVAARGKSIAPARKTPWWVWLIVASVPAIAAAVWLWLRR